MQELSLVFINKDSESSAQFQSYATTDLSFTEASNERLIQEESTQKPQPTCLSKVKSCFTRCYMMIQVFLLWCHQKKILPLFFLIPFILANYLYMSCDEVCEESNFMNCLFRVINKKISIWLIKVFLAAVLFGTLILVPFYYKKFIPIYICPLAVINVIYLLFFFDNTLTGNSYGQAFAILLALDLVYVFTMFGISRIIIFCYRKRPRITVAIVALLVVGGLSWFYFARFRGSCDHWATGLGGDQINNDVTCTIRTPSICQYDILEGVADLSLWECSSFKPDEDLMNKYYPQGAPIIGLPRIEQTSDRTRTWDDLQDYVIKNAVALESFEDPAAKDLEIFVDQRDKDNTKLVIDVKRNETLVEERMKLQDDEGLAKNIIVVFIDTLSRARFYKKLPQTAAWFEKYYNGKSAERESYQFFKFHGVTPYTLNNMLAFNFGVVPDFWSDDSKPPESEDQKPRNYIEQFKNKGYITGKSGNMCDAFSTVPASWSAYLKDTAYDHEGQTIACDPNYQDPVTPFSAMKGPFSIRRKCLYGTDTFNHVLGYGNSFMSTYADQKKLLYMEFLDAHEVTQEAVKYMDTSMVNFFESLDRGGLLNDTMILFWSDHGNHMPFPPYNIWKDTTGKELALPNLIFVLPRKMNSKYGAAVKSNQQRLFSAYQLHDLLMTFPNGVKSSHMALSPLSTLSTLTCEDIKVVMQPCYCDYPEGQTN